MTWAHTIERYLAEGRTVSGAKGDQDAQNEENQETNFSKQLMDAFATNNAAQQNQLNFLNNKIQAAINNPQGYSASTLAAMRAQATDQVASQTQNAERAGNAFTQRGGSGIPSGVGSQINAEIATQAGEAGNAAQQQITEENANLEQENLRFAENEELGIAGAENPEGMAGEGNQAGGEVSNLSQAVTASSGPTTGAILGGIVSAGLGAAGSILCPAEGSMYLLPDGTEKAVETLCIGEQIAGIDGEPQTIEDIQSGFLPVVQVVTENGKSNTVSPSHAFALSKGGFTVAAKSMGRVIQTSDGPSTIKTIEATGKRWVFNIITDGSHTYRADGIWAFGVGEAERHVGMNQWASISKKLIERELVAV